MRCLAGSQSAFWSYCFAVSSPRRLPERVRGQRGGVRDRRCREPARRCDDDPLAFSCRRRRTIDAAALDAALRAFMPPGCSRTVTISRDGDRILVKVVENPTIDRMAFEGNKKIKDEDLKKTVQSKAGGPLRAPWSTAMPSASSSFTASAATSRCASIRKPSAPGTSASISCSRSRRATSSQCGRSSSSATTPTPRTSLKARSRAARPIC